VASANCARYCGASVDFVDIDPHTYNLSVDCLREKLATAEKHGRLPKVVEPVHFAGCPCDMAEIRALADQYGFRILEDASHALGASYRGEKIGACGYSDIAVFSFHPVKMITTGEGGMAVTQDPELADRMRLLRSHGITRDPDRMTHESDGPWYYQQVEFGYHYRLTDLQAALGYSQLQRLDEFVARRNQLAHRYDQLLADLPVQRPTVPADRHSSFHLYPLLVDPDRRRGLFESLRAAGYGVNVHYIPVHTQPEIAATLSALAELPASEDYYRREISIPLHPELTDEQQDAFTATFRELLA
jgi:dTDP-4-amino-4,6-dideoxygalactose transaminase